MYENNKKTNIMNGILKNVISFVLLIAIVAIAYAIVQSIQEPVKFNKEKAAREAVAIQRLKDIRTLQVAYKSVNGKFTADFDSLAMFYNSGQMDVIMQIGSNDDSLAVANTEALKKKQRGITPQQMLDLYRAGQKLVFSIKRTVNVKDTLFHSRQDFSVDSLKYIPFSGGQKVEMDAVTKMVSGVSVPLFVAKVPYKVLLTGMNRQLIINLNADREAGGQYEGLQVGSIDTPNNNAGNWE